MAYISIFDETTLVFKRSSTGGGVMDANFNYIEAPETNIVSVGDLQPCITKALTQFETPAGFVKRGVLQYSTKTKLRTVDEYTGNGADYTTIDGRKYYVMSDYNFSYGSVLSTDYNLYILMIKALTNDGAV